MKNQTSGVVKGSYHQRSGHEGVNGGGVARLQITKILGSQTAQQSSHALNNSTVQHWHLIWISDHERGFEFLFQAHSHANKSSGQKVLPGNISKLEISCNSKLPAGQLSNGQRLRNGHDPHAFRQSPKPTRLEYTFLEVRISPHQLSLPLQV